MFKLLEKIMGSPHERKIKKLQPILAQINAYEPEMQGKTDDQLREMTATFKARFQQEWVDKGGDKLKRDDIDFKKDRRRITDEILDGMLPEAFAVVREAGKRVLNMRHFDVQLLGGMILHKGQIAEMRTGEGKTLVATAPTYLNALTGRGVHVVTVNDYLAKRDSEWMGQIHRFLGLEVGCIQHHLSPRERKIGYGSDVTYGTNNEFGFDYLRDNMATSGDDKVQRELVMAVVDEVDSILIDEARTPLIISGLIAQSADTYNTFSRLAPRLDGKVKKQNVKKSLFDETEEAEDDCDYLIDEKAKNIILTERGIARVEKLLNVQDLFGETHPEYAHHLLIALKAKDLYRRDVEYVIRPNEFGEEEVVIVDEFTGRLMFGRRYSDGLHQAIEAKEGVRIQDETQTLATITFQNYFRMYDKLSGMTGTAETEEAELGRTYDLDVTVVPTNRPMVRQDYADQIYKTVEAKFNAVAAEVEEMHKLGRPTLVGTVSIEKSEYLAGILKKRGVPHKVLNAKHHEKEAEIIKLAGQTGAVTIATNMAGRGTDIILGDGVPDLGGLHIIGTERHESRRIDNQLRGRAGRQGDPGSSRFYLSLEDDLMRLFGGDRIARIMELLKVEDDMAIEAPMVSKAIENAQRKVEMHHTSVRKSVKDYDDVMNQQRVIIYKQRSDILAGESLRPVAMQFIERVVAHAVQTYAPHGMNIEEWDREGLLQALAQHIPLLGSMEVSELDMTDSASLSEYLIDQCKVAYEVKESSVGAESMRELERMIILRVIDQRWIDHLHELDALREGIGLRAYGQKDPLIEYKREAHDLFQDMMQGIRTDSVSMLFHMQIEYALPQFAPVGPQTMHFMHGEENLDDQA
jgi:preprotein translocase subunit SecA